MVAKWERCELQPHHERVRFPPTRPNNIETTGFFSLFVHLPMSLPMSLLAVGPGAGPVSRRWVDRSRRGHQQPCYASGEAARLSIERDGFESRTGRQFNRV